MKLLIYFMAPKWTKHGARIHTSMEIHTTMLAVIKCWKSTQIYFFINEEYLLPYIGLSI